MKSGIIVLVVIVVVGLVLGAQLMESRNQLVIEKNDIDGKWAQVDVDIKRRADLIPSLVETVKGIAKQEQTVIGEVANARACTAGRKEQRPGNCHQQPAFRGVGAFAGFCRRIIRN